VNGFAFKANHANVSSFTALLTCVLNPAWLARARNVSPLESAELSDETIYGPRSFNRNARRAKNVGSLLGAFYFLGGLGRAVLFSDHRACGGRDMRCGSIPRADCGVDVVRILDAVVIIVKAMFAAFAVVQAVISVFFTFE
jgi:hypothetical protein